MERALDRCVTKTIGPKTSDAMGHTHRPCAKRICVRVGDPDGWGK